VLGANMDVVGLIGPCATANLTRFPYNTPVLVFSNDITLATDLGDDGYLMDAINAINGQLADLEVSVQIVIVVTAYGSADAFNLQLQQTIANIMGDSVARTGVWAFLSAPNTLYCTPRLISAPGYTGQMANSLDTLLIDVAGVGYTPNAVYEVIFAAGEGETNSAQLVLPEATATAGADGSIQDADIVITSYGAWMTVAPAATMPAPDGPPIVAVAAAGQIIFTATPGIGSTITLNGSVVSFIVHGGSPSGNQVALGTDLPSTLANLLTFLNASADTQIAKCTYAVAVATLNITDKTPGSAGNGFALACTVSGATLSGSTLAGGIDAAASTTATLTATIALGANPVCAALSGGCLDSLMAHAVVESAGTSTIDDENWRDTLNSQRLIPTSGGIKVLDDGGDIVVMPVAPRVIGLLIATDFRTGYPFHSAANQPVNGVVGPARTIDFSLTDGGTEGQLLLAANLGIVVRGLIGVETAISSGGFNYVGTDNAGDDPLWQFYNVTRGRDFLELSLMPVLRTYLGRTNIDQQTVINVVDTMQGFLDLLTSLQQILGGEATFQGSLNSASEIRLGHIVVSMQAEEPPVLRRITTMSARFLPAIDALVAQLSAELSQTP
jgi:hypothetical protein